jgi:hypothetical protein
LECGTRVPFKRAGSELVEEDATTSVYRFDVPAGFSQRVHLTTCGDKTNVDTVLSAFRDTIE